ncbi:MAG TPA: GDP-mannose 4,6-dehydratase, partial [Candidatus Omnitrophota bacterium]|nr:GDP-mannose 4,6-dehydratase [Candidatus Omnitrophota bacterium]
ANSASTAMDFLKDKTPDLILLDLVMPGMDGYEILQKIKLDSRTKDIPVIVLTGRTYHADKIKALSMGIEDYITKPYEPEEFYIRIKTILKRTRSGAQKKVKNVLITGGAGFIGSILSRELLKKKFNVTIIDDFSTGRMDNVKDLLNNPNFTSITGSITDEAIVGKAVEKCDIIYHLAATVGVKNVVERPLDTIIYDTIGSSIVFKYASSKGVKVILASTSEVYGKSQKFPFREDDDVVIGPPDVNRWSYACSKLLDEFLAKGYHHERGMPAVILRFFNIVGPGQVGSYGMVIPRFFKSALNNEPIHIYGDGKQLRCFTYVYDAVDLIIKLASNKKADGEVINLGSNNQISIKDLAYSIKRITKSKSKIVFEPYYKYYGHSFEDVKRRVPDLSKLKKIAGSVPKTSIEEILKDIYDYYKERPKELKSI